MLIYFQLLEIDFIRARRRLQGASKPAHSKGLGNYIQ